MFRALQRWKCGAMFSVDRIIGKKLVNSRDNVRQLVCKSGKYVK